MRERSGRVTLRIFAVAGLAAALAACASRSPPPAPQRAPVVTERFCQERLARTGAAFSPVASPAGTRAGCALLDGVEVAALSVAFNRPVVLSCPTALTFERYVQEVVQPAARRHLGGRVVEVRQAGGYVCRNRSGTAGRLSEHAKGRAIDIWGFALEDGTRISVRDHWTGAGARSRFLREIARAACNHFSVVLSPDHDRDHHDHLHLDVGPWSLCGA